MTRVLSLSTAVSLLGAALLSTAASATDFSEGADFGGTYGYIGPGVASLPDLDVDVGPLGAGVYVEPGIAFMSPAMDYASPASTWAPVYPQAQLEVVPAAPESIDFGPGAVGVDQYRAQPSTHASLSQHSAGPVQPARRFAIAMMGLPGQARQ